MNVQKMFQNSIANKGTRENVISVKKKISNKIKYQFSFLMINYSKLLMTIDSSIFGQFSFIIFIEYECIHNENIKRPAKLPINQRNETGYSKFI